MDCPQCGHEQSDQNTECMKCGIIFAKWQKRQAHLPRSESADPIAIMEQDSDPDIFRALFFHLPEEVLPIVWGFRLMLLIILCIWGVRFIAAPINSNITLNSIWHLVNLPFHEAGHIFFRPFGRLMTSLGGSLMQVLMPVICLCVFLLKTRDPFAGSFALWWTGQNFIDLAPYINDARSLSLPLLGGNIGRHTPYGFHDWEFILRETHLIHLDRIIARLAHGMGALLIITAIVWGGMLLTKQYTIMRHTT